MLNNLKTMTKIEEVAKKYAEIMGLQSDYPHHKQSSYDGFIDGVEFAQKFINVDEKIPIEFTPVLFKTKNGGLYLGIYYSKKEYGKWFRSVEEPDIDYCVDLDNQDEVIEWRYVDL